MGGVRRMWEELGGWMEELEGEGFKRRWEKSRGVKSWEN